MIIKRCRSNESLGLDTQTDKHPQQQTHVGETVCVCVLCSRAAGKEMETKLCCITEGKTLLTAATLLFFLFFLCCTLADVLQSQLLYVLSDFHELQFPPS